METIAHFFKKIIKGREDDIVNFVFNNMNKSKKSFLKTLAFVFEMRYT